LNSPAYLFGLRQNAADRSNVAFENLGGPEQGDITLRVTVISGDPGQPFQQDLPEITLSPGGWSQLSGVLHSNGLAVDNGYVRIERIAGAAPFYAYGVVNDQANSDGSFILPITAGSLTEQRNWTLPVVVETEAYSSELIMTNVGSTSANIGLSDSQSGFSLTTIQAGEQRIIPDLIQYLREHDIPNVGSPGQPLAEALTVNACMDPDCQKIPRGLFFAVRTLREGGGGRYGVSYNAVRFGESSTGEVWLDDLQQDSSNRTNLALVNTGEKDRSTDTFRIDVYDGNKGTLVGAIEEISVDAFQWRQLESLLTQAGLQTTQGYVHITQTGGSNPFIAYAVVNNGGNSGTGTGDGAYIASAASQEPSGFRLTGSLQTPRSGHTATLLENGKVLVAGGSGDASAELYDPVTETFSPTGNMSTPRYFHTATLLSNGKVLIAGGYGPKSNLNSAEIYDPTNGTFSVTGSMSVARNSHTSTLLKDGRVLITGGGSDQGLDRAVNSAEIYDTANGIFIVTGSMLSERANHTATLLTSGEVLISGGWNGNAPDASDDPPFDPQFVETFDPSARNFRQAGYMNSTRSGHTATLLRNGKVAVIGGWTDMQDAAATLQLYDPASRTFSASGKLAEPRMGHSATLLANGEVLIAGGEDPFYSYISNGIPVVRMLSSAELYNPASGSLTVIPGLQMQRGGHTATLLKSGAILIVGGTDNTGNPLASAEIYR
jgi:hypothetical protein